MNDGGEEEIMRNLAGNLTRARWANGLSCPDLAKLCGAGDPQQVTRSEKCGKLPRADLLARWAVALGVSTDFLLFHHAEPVYGPDHKDKEPRGFAQQQRSKFAYYAEKGRAWIRTVNAQAESK